MITLAGTNAERRAAERLWAQHGDWVVHSGIICDPADDDVYLPLVAQVHIEGRLVGATYTRPLRSFAEQANDPDEPNRERCRELLPRYIELDAMAVDPRFRGQGIGAAMLNYLEPKIRARGGRMLFGQVTSDAEASFLRRYYSQLGFRCMPEGEPLPPMLGMEMEHRDPSVVWFFFWKQLKASA